MLKAKEKAELRHRHYCALLSLKNLEGEKVDEIQQSAIEQVYAYEDAFLPNAKEVRREDEKDQARERIGQWEQRWGGKMSDPKMQERIRQTAEALRAMRVATAKEEGRGSIEGLMGLSRRQKRNVSRAHR